MRINALSIMTILLSLAATGLAVAGPTQQDKTTVSAEGGARIEADDAAGLHIRENIDYGGMPTDVGTGYTDAYLAGSGVTSREGGDER